jgi:hypothetical protein
VDNSLSVEQLLAAVAVVVAYNDLLIFQYQLYNVPSLQFYV